MQQSKFKELEKKYLKVARREEYLHRLKFSIYLGNLEKLHEYSIYSGKKCATNPQLK